MTKAHSSFQLAASDVEGDKVVTFGRAAIDDFIPLSCMTDIVQREMPLTRPEERHMGAYIFCFAKHVVCRDDALLLSDTPVLDTRSAPIAPAGNIPCRIHVGMVGLQLI